MPEVSNTYTLVAMEDCIFCKIVAGDAPAKVFKETENVVAFDNIRPAADVHILIVPKKHISTFIDLDDESLIGELFSVVRDLVKEKNLEKGYRVSLNGGKYQVVKHVHWHLLGGELKEDYT